jgi:hypothetical protein
MADLTPIKEQLKTLAASCGYPPRRVEVKDNGSSHTLTCDYVGKREETHVAIARLTKSLSDGGLVELPQGSVASEENLYNTFRQTARDRDTFLGNITLTGKSDTMFTLSIKTPLPADTIALKLQDALGAHARKEAKQQITHYMADRIKQRLPGYTCNITKTSVSPTQETFSMYLENASAVIPAAVFRMDMVDLLERAERIFGDTTAVNLSLQNNTGTLSVTGNPAQLLDAIKQKDPHFISPQTGKTR